jgi:hypothetical protein
MLTSISEVATPMRMILWQKRVPSGAPSPSPREPVDARAEAGPGRTQPPRLIGNLHARNRLQPGWIVPYKSAWWPSRRGVASKALSCSEGQSSPATRGAASRRYKFKLKTVSSIATPAPLPSTGRTFSSATFHCLRGGAVRGPPCHERPPSHPPPDLRPSRIPRRRDVARQKCGQNPSQPLDFIA